MWLWTALWLGIAQYFGIVEVEAACLLAVDLPLAVVFFRGLLREANTPLIWATIQLYNNIDSDI